MIVREEMCYGLSNIIVDNRITKDDFMIVREEMCYNLPNI